MLGRHLTRKLLDAGWDVSVLSHAEIPQLSSTLQIISADLTREGDLRSHLKDVDVLVHCASNPRDFVRVDVEGTERLLKAAARVPHVIYVSIAGVDRSSYPYYQAKYQVERMLRNSSVDWSIVRATQFHDLVLNRIIKPGDRGAGVSLTVPGGLRFQSIDVEEVADYLTRVAIDGATRETVTLGGPHVLTIDEMARIYLTVLGRTDALDLRHDPLPFYDVFRSGVNVNRDWTYGRITWRQYLNKVLAT